jgi:hypothetical protein
MPVHGSGPPAHVVHAAINPPREQASMRPNPKVVLVPLWPCGDMLIASNPHSLHLFVVVGTLAMWPGQMTAIKPRNSIHLSLPHFSKTGVALGQ